MLGALSNFEKNTWILQKTLDSSMLRWNALSNNIANVNTPGFKRSDVKFASQLKRALDSQTLPNDALPGKRTNTKHFDFYPTMDYTEIKPKIHTEYDTVTNNNGNNVDMAFETGESLKTSLLYSATSSVLQRNFNLLKDMTR